MDKKDIEKYILELIKKEEKFKGSLTPKELNHKSLLLKNVYNFFIAFSDFIYFILNIHFNKRFFVGKKIIYTAPNFIINKNGVFTDRILPNNLQDNIIYINESKGKVINKIDGHKVFNFGPLVKILNKFSDSDNQMLSSFYSYQKINNYIINKFNSKITIIIYWFYNMNGLSLVFSENREKINLIEIQHGSIINYPPYSEASPIKIVDTFYVKNQQTVNYLKTTLCSKFKSNYKLIPYQKNNKTNYRKGINLLYASTIEFNGLHPVLKDFLRLSASLDIYLKIRLHPREKDKRVLFEDQMKVYNIKYDFDDSENWLVSNDISNLIIVSPWSSTIEDAYDNGFQTIIIDKVGEKRYSHLIDNKICFFTQDLFKFLK